MKRAFLAPRAALGAALLAAACTPAMSPALAEEPAPTLSLSATATAEIAPDYALVRSGVTVRGETADAAVAQNAAQMQAVFDALEAAGVERRHIQTSNFSVQPVWDWNGQREERVFRGYEVRNQVAARLSDLDAIGSVIDAMVRGGANDIQGISFGAEDNEAAMDDLRREAVGDVMARARLYAEAGGFELCGIRTLSEGGGGGGAPVMAMARMAAAEAAPTQIAAGELTLSLTVNASFCIEN